MRILIRIVGAIVGVVAAAWSPWPIAEAAVGRARVPLGDTLYGQAGDRHFGVFIPTRYGGVLTIRTTSGEVDSIVGPDGRPRRNGEEVGTNQHGWYTFKVSGATRPYDVSTSFVQVGQSAKKPWNFYYWPTKADSIHEPWAGGNGRVDTMQAFGDDIQVASYGSYIAPGQDIILAGANGLLESMPAPGDTSTWFPNQYDDLTFRGADGTLYQTPAPMLKYDQIFGSAARGYEASMSSNFQDIQRWPGHCLGGAVASILLNEPVPAPGSGLTRDELKALWAELGENHLNHRIGDYVNEIAAGPPRPGWDPTDRSVPHLHAMLERHIRGERKILLANLRAFPPRGTVNEVWNHGVGQYSATFHAIPGKGERAVRLDVEVVANAGSSLNGRDTNPRVVKYAYSLVYGLNGEVDEMTPGNADWISVGGEAMFAPLNVLELVESRWAGHNPYVTEANVRSLDQANGGGFSPRLAGAPPQFRPVGNYEAGRSPFGAPNGRGPLFAFGNRSNSDVSTNPYGMTPEAPTPRGGFFGRIFGR
jgi:hypothetical protein